MFIKDTFKDWDEKCIKVVYFDNLNYIRTFSIEEFKEIIKKGESTFTDFSQTIFNEIDIDKLKKETKYEG